MSDVEIWGWLGLGLLVLVAVVRLRRWTRAKDAAARSVAYSVTAHERTGTQDALTKREVQIAQLLVAGKRNAAIAEELHISVYTVESHIKRIYTKLEVHNRLELARKLHELSE